MWIFTIAVAFAYDGAPWMHQMSAMESKELGLVLVFAISLFILVSLIRFDKAARSSGMYAKEKESYSGQMDLYNKAQEAHYEYVKLRASAEAQQIMEKYPQLGPSKGNTKVAES